MLANSKPETELKTPFRIVIGKWLRIGKFSRQWLALVRIVAPQTISIDI